MIYFTDEISRNVGAGRLMGALDTVPRKKLNSKLKRFGLVENYFAALGNELSSPLVVENGVPQAVL